MSSGSTEYEYVGTSCEAFSPRGAMNFLNLKLKDQPNVQTWIQFL